MLIYDCYACEITVVRTTSVAYCIIHWYWRWIYIHTQSKLPRNNTRHSNFRLTTTVYTEYLRFLKSFRSYLRSPYTIFPLKNIIQK